MSDISIYLGFVVAGAAALQAWRWYLDDRKLQRAHELELRKLVVQVEQSQLDQTLALVKKWEDRIKGLEYRKS